HLYLQIPLPILSFFYLQLLVIYRALKENGKYYRDKPLISSYSNLLFNFYTLSNSKLFFIEFQIFECSGQKYKTLRSEEHTSELQSRFDLVCRLLLEKKKHTQQHTTPK